jgi:TATA-binding protein-associated factor
MISNLFLTKETTNTIDLFRHAGQLAMDVLHKQIKPFMLRRLKSDVLDDLPPKILQDYYCDLSFIQLLLYEDFANKTKEQLKYTDNDCENQKSNSTGGTGHVFKVDENMSNCVRR